ncbi:hypothetical protein PSAB6_380001 [Paraburkholderia sabiae]|nr:hypothetical protein PSAB6_380001 [Paraburkholderia sabiae]
MTVGFLRSVVSLCNSSKNLCRGVILAGTVGSKAAFFGYFLCRGKESNCRPAQGQRLKYGYEFADASEGQNQKTKNPKNQTQAQPAQGYSP